MCNDRPYRKALGHQQALAEIKKGAGTQFEPELVELFFQMVHVVQLSKDECDSDEMDRIHNKFINLSSTC
jgi:HD-GYP domain-containing protein (c-di-GMP phosphodiesterase class II)